MAGRPLKATGPIASICKAYGVSRAEFARRAGVPVRTLENWDAGIGTPSKQDLMTMEFSLSCGAKDEDERLRCREIFRKRKGSHLKNYTAEEFAAVQKEINEEIKQEYGESADAFTWFTETVRRMEKHFWVE